MGHAKGQHGAGAAIAKMWAGGGRVAIGSLRADFLVSSWRPCPPHPPRRPPPALVWKSLERPESGVSRIGSVRDLTLAGRQQRSSVLGQQRQHGVVVQLAVVDHVLVSPGDARDALATRGRTECSTRLGLRWSWSRRRHG